MCTGRTKTWNLTWLTCMSYAYAYRMYIQSYTVWLIMFHPLAFFVHKHVSMCDIYKCWVHMCSILTTASVQIIECVKLYAYKRWNKKSEKMGFPKNTKKYIRLISMKVGVND